jgi:hypothetical protein
MKMRSLGAAALFAPEGYLWRCRHRYDLGAAGRVGGLGFLLQPAGPILMR